jgi:hypothetical protein
MFWNGIILYVSKKLAFEGGRFSSILEEFRVIGRDSQDFLNVFNHFIYGDGLLVKNYERRELTLKVPLVSILKTTIESSN